MKITDFVVGLGFDSTDFEKGMTKASKQLGGFKSDILQLGALLGTAFSFKKLTFDFARDVDELRQLATMIGVTADELYGLNEAGKAFGAGQGELANVLSNLANQRANFQKLGKIGIFEELAKLGVNFDKIALANNELEAMYILADQLSKLDTQERMLAADILGLTPQSLELLSQGSDSIKELSEAYQKARPQTEAMSKASRDFIEQWNLLQATLGGKLDIVSTPLVAKLTEIIEMTNKWFDANSKVIDQDISAFLTGLADTTEAVTKTFNDFLAAFKNVGKKIGGFFDPVVDFFTESDDEEQSATEDARADAGYLISGSLLENNGSFTDAAPNFGVGLYKPEWLNVNPLGEAYALGYPSSGLRQATPIQNDVHVNVVLDGQKIYEGVERRVQNDIYNTINDVRTTENR